MNTRECFDGEISDAYIAVEGTHEQIQQVGSWLVWTVKLYCLVAMLALPLAFGGVHPVFSIPFAILSFVTLALLLVGAPAAVQSSFAGRGSLSRLTLIGMSVLIAYATAQSVYLECFVLEPHPVLGATSRLSSPIAAFEGIRALALFLAIFVIFRVAAQIKQIGVATLERYAIASAGVVAVTGLVHWLYDNGRLFWVFKPESLFISDRARWPFVNPNHLGAYLVGLVFLAVGAFERRCILVSARIRRSLDRRVTWAEQLSSSALQWEITGVLLLGAICLISALATLATLSRGAWAGLAFGLALFIGFHILAKEAPASPRNVINLASAGRRRRRSHRSSTDSSNWAVKATRQIWNKLRAHPILTTLGFTFAALVFALNDRGLELVTGRVEYGLVYSLDDLRWTMYRDSLALLAANPIIGTGLGGWNALYPAVASSEMSGLRPVYLHSDPLQFLIELGIVGGVIVLFFASIAVVKTVISFARAGEMERQGLRGASVGIIGLLVASVVEFPLRMPAIAAMLALLFAITAFYVDKGSWHDPRRTLIDK